MNEIKVQANASQVEVAAQLVNGKSVVGQTEDTNNNVKPVLPDNWTPNATIPKAGVPHTKIIVTDSAVPLGTLTAMIGKFAEMPDEDSLITPIDEDEEWEAFLQDIAENRYKIDDKLFSGEEIQLADFLNAGYGFADMPAHLQRKETKKNVADLQRSLLACGKFYRPIEIVPVKDFIEAGLGTPVRPDGTPISIIDQDVELLFVRADGKQRSCAAAKIFTNKKYVGKEKEYDIRVKICPAPIKELPTYIREIQTAAVWDEKTKRETTAAFFREEESGLSLMNQFINESGMTARAAYKLVYYKEGYKKALYEESMATAKLHKDLQASPEIVRRAKHTYEAFKIAFRSYPKYLKNSAAIDALIDIYTSATENQTEAVDLFLTFLKTLGEEKFKDLSKAKTVAEKKLVLIEVFDEFKKKLATTPSFKDDVEKLVKTAEENYKAQEGKVNKNDKKAKARPEVSYYAVGAHTI